MTQNTKTGVDTADPRSQLIQNLYEASDYSSELLQHSITPEILHNIFEVEISLDCSRCFAESAAAGDSWAWDVFDTGAVERLQLDFHLYLGSSQFHWIRDVCEDDFVREQPIGTLQENDEETTLGRRVVLQGLKARPELNGLIARCGPWLRESGRYHVVIVPQSQARKRQYLSVKPSNLRFAAHLANEELHGHLQGKFEQSDECFSPGPLTVSGCWALTGKDFSRSPLLSEEGKAEDYVFCQDTYKGPISARALAMLEFCGERPPNADAHIALVRMHGTSATTKKAKENAEKSRIWNTFVKKMRLSDSSRVESWQSALLSRRKDSVWTEWVKLKVTQDGFRPALQRELLVSPQLTIAVR